MNENFELDRQLYEVSKWHKASQRWCYIDETGEGEKWVLKLGCPSKEFHDIPHYDLEYLLEKLPAYIDEDYFDMCHYGDGWECAYQRSHRGLWNAQIGSHHARTPRQAALKLAIALFEQNILKPAGEGA